MSWILIAMGAHLLWACVNVADKYVIGNRVKNPLVYMAWLSLFGLGLALAAPMMNLSIPTGSVAGWLILAGASHLLGGLIYIKALEIEEVTRINIWWHLIPVFSLGAAWIFLGEKLNPAQIGAMGILIAGGVLASAHYGRRMIRFSKALGLMVLACLSYTVYGISWKYVSENIALAPAFIWMNLIMGLFILLLFVYKKFRQDFLEETPKLKQGKFLALIIGIAIVDIVATGFNIWSLKLGPVALVFAMGGWQTLFVFAIAILITIKNKDLLKEELDKKNLILKLAALVLMMIGVAIINLG